MTSCMCKSCLVLPVKEEFAQFATIRDCSLFMPKGGAGV